MTKYSSRYEYAVNLNRSENSVGNKADLWESPGAYELLLVDFEEHKNKLTPKLSTDLCELAGLIDSEWQDSKKSEFILNNLIRRNEIAACLRKIGSNLDHDERKALLARADYVERGSDDIGMDQLYCFSHQQIFFAGLLSTWYGKEVRGRPSAFAMQRSNELDTVLQPLINDRTVLNSYLEGLHKNLFISEPPQFLPGELFFMAGEANLHPKHIAYFLPEDEGIKKSPIKSTLYFSNVHQTKTNEISWPLFREFFAESDTTRQASNLDGNLAAAGVLAHEIGHFVQRKSTSYAELNKTDRWVSIVLQEVAADVFGTLFLAEVWASQLEGNSENAIMYYLADSLSYISRGLGLFPDSDGMTLQLNYLADFGAIVVSDGESPRISYSTQNVIAGLRSLARVLSDTLLDGQTHRALSLHTRYGPAQITHLQPVFSALSKRPTKSIEYVQDFTSSQ